MIQLHPKISFTTSVHPSYTVSISILRFTQLFNLASVCWICRSLTQVTAHAHPYPVHTPFVKNTKLPNSQCGHHPCASYRRSTSSSGIPGETFVAKACHMLSHHGSSDVQRPKAPDGTSPWIHAKAAKRHATEKLVLAPCLTAWEELRNITDHRQKLSAMPKPSTVSKYEASVCDI